MVSLRLFELVPGRPAAAAVPAAAAAVPAAAVARHIAYSCFYISINIKSIEVPPTLKPL